MSSATTAAPIRLGTVATAAAYVSTDFGSFQAEAGAFLIAAGAIDRSIIGAPEIVYLTGQSDLLMTLRLNTLRPVSDLRYPGEGSRARVFNWVFSVPLDSALEPSRLLSAPVRFTIHLRVRRGAYTARPVLKDQEVVQHVAGVLDAFQLEAEIAIGLGWSDYIVSGGLEPEQFDDFVRALVVLHESHIPTPTAPFPIFQRTLTLMGYHPNETAGVTFDAVRPIIFGRSLPGQLTQVRAALQNLGITAPHVYIIDGKSDLVIVPRRATPEFLTLHQRFCNTPPPHNRGRQPFEIDEMPIQRLETHLLFLPTQAKDESASDLQRSRMPGPVDSTVRGVCPCRDRLRGVDRVRSSHPVFPDELRTSISNVRLLFNAALRDRTGCCDISRAVEACERGLFSLATRLSKRTDKSHAARGTPDEIRLHTDMVDEKKQIEIWCLLSERLLRQRTVGSFEELLGQTDRAIAYRGGVQKFLVIADALMNDFAALVTKHLFVDASKRPLFASLYDAVSSIRSHRGTGLVLIPVKHLFRLPLVIPDLWHEVGTTLFFTYSDVDFTELAASVDAKELFDIDSLYRDMADIFADLVVFLYGFRRDFAMFETSLVRGWMEANREHETAPAVYAQHYKQLLIRLYTAYELVRRTAPNEVPRGTSTEELIFDIDQHVRFSFPILAVDADTARRDAAAFIDTDLYHAWIRMRIVNGLRLVPVPVNDFPTVPQAILEGYVTELAPTDDLNALFARFYEHREALRNRKLPVGQAEQDRTRQARRAHLFRSMAALGRSVTIEQIRRETTA